MKTVSIIAALTTIVACTITDAARYGNSRTQNILEYRVTLEPDFKRAWVKGKESIFFDPQSLSEDELIFTANDLTVANAMIDGVSVETRVQNRELRIKVPRAQRRNRLATLKLAFEGAPGRGFDLKSGSIVTGYFACNWMICNQDAFGDKARFTLDLVLPKPMTTIGPGSLAESGILANGKSHARWETDHPYSAYLYAFAVGNLKSTSEVVGATELRLVDASTSDAELKRLFASTVDMLAFFVEKAGAAFPHPAYTQLLVDGGAAQEAVSHSIIGRQTIEPILNDPSEDWVIAHELAHQWWGNAITCTELSEFWLNEGVTTFMVAAWKEHRWGREAYMRELELSRRRLAATGEQWERVPLTYGEPYPSLSIRRAVQYNKGQLFMDALRTELGERTFWTSFAAYTREHIGKSVTSRDFQASFERSSKRDLSSLFDAWVY